MWEWAEGEQGKWETDGGGNVKGRLSAQARLPRKTSFPDTLSMKKKKKVRTSIPPPRKWAVSFLPRPPALLGPSPSREKGSISGWTGRAQSQFLHAVLQKLPARAEITASLESVQQTVMVKQDPRK